jgi:hypothetical protein
MAAPTSTVQKLKKILANVGPSTHGLQQAFDAQTVRVYKTIYFNICLGSIAAVPVFSHPQARHVGFGILMLTSSTRPRQFRP